MCLPIYSCLYLQQFFTTFILRHLHLFLIADGIEWNITAWLSSSHVCLISSIWHSMHLLHDCTVMFDTNDGSLLQISFQYLFIVNITKLYFSYIHSSKISDHNCNSASAILVVKQSEYWLLYSPFLLGWLMYQFWFVMTISYCCKLKCIWNLKKALLLTDIVPWYFPLQ